MRLKLGTQAESDNQAGRSGGNRLAAGESGGNPHPLQAAPVGCSCERSLQPHAMLAAVLVGMHE
jgi:hypothetical protein